MGSVKHFNVSWLKEEVRWKISRLRKGYVGLGVLRVIIISELELCNKFFLIQFNKRDTPQQCS